MRMLTTLLLSLVLFATQSQAASCGTIEEQLQKAHLKHLTVQSITPSSVGGQVELKYSGFFLKENAKQEARRIISILKKCNTVSYQTETSLFSYSTSIKLSKK